jgi:hypothetical protein
VLPPRPSPSLHSTVFKPTLLLIATTHAATNADADNNRLPSRAA